MAQMPINPDLAAFSLAGKRALVTGGSAGIGKHLAGVLARAGATVALAARRQDKVDEAAHELCQQGCRAFGVTLDVSDVASHEKSFAAAEAALGGKANILVNCAGILLAKHFLKQTEAEVRQMFDTNLLGAYFVAQRAAQGMVDAGGGGSIINVSSSAGIMGCQMLSSYSITKAGIIHLTKIMALELARYQIRVNVICPGNIETDMHQVFVGQGLEDSVKKRIPQRRLGQVADLTGATLLLASEAGAYMTGAVVAVDGGQVIS